MNNEELLDQLTPEIQSKLEELAEKGNVFERQKQYKEALEAWKQALDLIPEPQQFFGQTVWFLSSIGDVYFQQGMYSQAHECFDKARGNLTGQGYDNPFVMLRLGSCCLEIGDEKNAIEYLLRAYMLDGDEIFEPDDDDDNVEKYFNFLKANVEGIE